MSKSQKIDRIEVSNCCRDTREKFLTSQGSRQKCTHTHTNIKTYVFLYLLFVGVEVQNSFKDKNLQARMNVLEVSESRTI